MLLGVMGPMVMTSLGPEGVVPLSDVVVEVPVGSPGPNKVPPRLVGSVAAARASVCERCQKK
jgi:hypothetical protein